MRTGGTVARSEDIRGVDTLDLHAGPAAQPTLRSSGPMPVPPFGAGSVYRDFTTNAAGKVRPRGCHHR
jgi:hypothetical protein